MDRTSFAGISAQDARALADDEKDEERRAAWLRLAHDIEVSEAQTAADLALLEADAHYHATGAALAEMTRDRAITDSDVGMHEHHEHNDE